MFWRRSFNQRTPNAAARTTKSDRPSQRQFSQGAARIFQTGSLKPREVSEKNQKFRVPRQFHNFCAPRQFLLPCIYARTTNLSSHRHLRSFSQNPDPWCGFTEMFWRRSFNSPARNAATRTIDPIGHPTLSFPRAKPASLSNGKSETSMRFQKNQKFRVLQQFHKF
jgi:hypothetical protein